MVLFMYEALRRDLRSGSTPWLLLGLSWFIFAGAAAFFYAMGLRTTWGQVSASALWTLVEGVIFVQAMRLRRTHASRGALIIALAMLLAISSHLLRIVYIGWMGGRTHLLDLQPVTNYFYLTNIIGVSLCSFGYWGYVLEKTRRNEMILQAQTQAAQTEARLALAHAEQMGVLVRQRNEMLMLNSRFSAIHSLATFNSVVIHEVSQPVQAISLCLDQAVIQAQRAGLELMREPLNAAQQQVGKVARLLAVMRKLVPSQGDAMEHVQLSEIETEILPVLRSEVSRRGAVLQEQWLVQGVTVSANKVLLERLLLNLVGNALDAFVASSLLIVYSATFLKLRVTGT